MSENRAGQSRRVGARQAQPTTAIMVARPMPNRNPACSLRDGSFQPGNPLQWCNICKLLAQSNILPSK